MLLHHFNLRNILILGFALRAIWALIVPVDPISDSAAYDTFAQNIWQHGTYGWEPDKPYSYWPVGTSGIYAGFYAVFGHEYWPIVIFNCLISVGIIYLTYTLALRFLRDEFIALAAAATIAIWPTGIMYVTVLGSELMYMFFSMAGIHAFFGYQKRWWLAGIIAGLLFAGAYYIRPLITVPFAICIFTALVVVKERVHLVALKSAIVATLIVIAVAPWAMRNYELHNAFVPMSTNSGAVFWMGNQPGSNGGYMPTPPEMKEMDTHLRSQLLKEQAMEYIKEEPVEFVSRTLFKFYKFHSYETIGVTWNEKGLEQVVGSWSILPLKGLTQAFWVILAIAAWLGLIVQILRAGFWSVAFNPMTLMWASSAGIHALIVSQDRYHIPSVPFIAMYAAITLHALLAKINKEKTTEPA